MARDFRKLRVFQLADALIIDIYRETNKFPPEERFGLQAQIRRAAVSTATNVVEGSARRSDRDRLHFLNIALGSACEVRYLLDLSARLSFLAPGIAREFDSRCQAIVGGLVNLTDRVAEQIAAG